MGNFLYEAKVKPKRWAACQSKGKPFGLNNPNGWNPVDSVGSWIVSVFRVGIWIVWRWHMDCIGVALAHGCVHVLVRLSLARLYKTI